MRKLTIVLAMTSSLLSMQAATAASSGHNNNNINFQVNDTTVSGGIQAMPNDNLQFSANGQYSSDNGTIGNVGVDFVQQNGRVEYGLGAKAIVLFAKGHDDGGVLALGGHYAYQLNDRLKAGGDVYYSPDILSFHHIDRYLSYGVKASYNAVDNVNVVVGWRRTTFGYSAGPDLRYQNNFYIGSDYSF
ncbi:YfaZ family outer membrane protein [Celerinatantimonas yamalensis]|uniref:YfaZ family outer membrane protein n=1 Tax=Celerinatantimonas yamalensis TaxID=559956 RepID=A0ABW9GBC0_9GAMM